MRNTAAEIVRLLRAGDGDVSGQKIAEQLGVTRAAVSKNIACLRDLGFEILSSTRVGYQLIAVPDIPSAEVLSSLLHSRVMGNKIEYHKEIISTNQRAMRLGHTGATEGTVVTADTQTGGKARGGKAWASPSGRNLYMSVILTPKISVDRTVEIERLALEALAAGVNNLCPSLPLTLLKTGLWSGRGKIGGILCEVCGEIDSIHHIVAGIGLNISHHDSLPDSESVFSLTGRVLSRAEVTASVLDNLEKLYLKWKRNEPVRSS